MVSCESKDGHQKDMCWKEIGLLAQNLLAILDAIVNIIGGPVWTLNDSENLHFDNENDMHMSSKKYEKSGYMHNLGLLIV